MIHARGLTKRFGDFTAVEQVDLDVRAGEVLALLGPNGAGKTTTVRMLCSTLAPTSGSAKVAGFDVARQPRQVRARVGVLTENHGLYNRMPALEYLDFYGQIYDLPKGRRRQIAQRLLEEFGLAADAHRRVGEYSKGMRQKLALARALLHNPPVLLLDEPTSAMDPESARLVRNAIHDLRSAERAVVLCTHNLAEAEELADQIAIVSRGRIAARGAAAELKRDLLGPQEFEVTFAAPVAFPLLELPAGATPLEFSDCRLRYQTQNPETVNPEVLQTLLNRGCKVISLHEVTRSLEQVYLHAINGSGMNRSHAATAAESDEQL